MGYGVDVDAYTGNILRLEQAQLTVEPTALPGQDGFIGLEAAKKLVLQNWGLPLQNLSKQSWMRKTGSMSWSLS